MRFTYILLAFCSVVMWSGCNTINPTEPVPTYVHIDSFSFKPLTTMNTGGNTHNITCAWVYYNGNVIGVFDLPVTVPVITSGTTGTLTIAPGIQVNGISSNQIIYPSYTYDTMALATNPGQMVTYTPKTQYRSNTSFLQIDDFENGNDFVKFTGDSALIRITDKSLVLDGSASAYIYLKSPDTACENICNVRFSYPTQTGYIEVDYKSTMPFAVGVEDYTASNSPTASYYIGGANPTSGVQKKIYFSLATPLGIFQNGVPGGFFSLLIRAELPAGQANGYVIIDDIKVVTLQ
ncbi:MAG: hypothetical protein H0X33_13020 [Taibaiella sp.]|nr:hypothetical protein [Taibaiella sp.]